ncbi:hypothetical protein EDC01DRAFT_635725 [Geopyxis carbonaria]|nr:hypothetical protein EDC01DRAFT_635725 [Geopyxis carbonaria]
MGLHRVNKSRNYINGDAAWTVSPAAPFPQLQVAPSPALHDGPFTAPQLNYLTLLFNRTVRFPTAQPAQARIPMLSPISILHSSLNSSTNSILNSSMNSSTSPEASLAPVPCAMPGCPVGRPLAPFHAVHLNCSNDHTFHESCILGWRLQRPAFRHVCPSCDSPWGRTFTVILRGPGENRNLPAPAPVEEVVAPDAASDLGSDQGSFLDPLAEEEEGGPTLGAGRFEVWAKVPRAKKAKKGVGKR